MENMLILQSQRQQNMFLFVCATQGKLKDWPFISFFLEMHMEDLSMETPTEKLFSVSIIDEVNLGLVLTQQYGRYNTVTR